MKKVWNKIKYYVIAGIAGIMALLSLKDKFKSKKQIADNNKTVSKNTEVVSKAEEIKKKTEGVIEDNEEIINKYSNLRNSD